MTDKELLKWAVEHGASVGPSIGEALAARLDGETRTVGRSEIWIPGWRPTSLNRLMYAKVYDRIKLKKRDTEIIGVFAHTCGVPLATCKRRVSLTITLGPRQRKADGDNLWKGLLDGLVSCNRLVDDNATWCEMGLVVWLPRGAGTPGTSITLEDML